jgi:gliding motility-associated-like protein
MGFATSATFIYTPQDSIFTTTTYTRNAGQSLTIDLGIDAAITTNVYKWFKNGVFYQTITGSNKLIFNNLQPSNAGIYTCQVTNPNAPLLTLYSRKATVNVNCALLAVPQTKPICQGSSYTLRNGRTYSTSGTYRDTIGCDTIYVINLVVNRRDSIELPKITRCYGADTTPVITRRTNLYGCDSIRVQRFRWAPALATVRLPIEYDCNLVRSVQDTNKIKNIAGCDSVWKIRTRIAVPKYNIELPLQYRCNPADTFRKIQQLTTRSYGCDSIITQRFILARPYLLDTTIWVCAPRDTATKIQRLRTSLGCDSTVIKRYVLARKDIKRLPDIIVCYARDTNTIRKSFLNRFGCDSTIIQRFRLEQQDTTILTETVCDTLFERTDTIPIRTKTKCEAIQIKHFVFQHCECLAKTAVFNGLIPNDGDAKNDVFLFDNIERFTPNELIITDKRNMLMYQVKNYKNDWSGTNQKGEPLPAGVYNYWFSITHPKTGEKCSRVGVVDIKYIP